MLSKGCQFILQNNAAPAALTLLDLRVDMGLSHADSAEVVLWSRDTFADIETLGQPALIRVELTNTRPWLFHGVVSRWERELADYQDGFRYRARLETWFGLLRHEVVSQCFANKTIIEILQRIFQTWESCNAFSTNRNILQYIF